MKIPGPDHPITIEPAAKRWRASFAGRVIADSTHALILREANYPPRIYFPRADVAMDHMSRTERSTHCPYKGDASYFTVVLGGEIAQNAVWSYEAPFPAMAEIAGRVSFYPEKIDLQEVEATAAGGVDIDEVVLHTDSGSGASQREHWAPTVSDPEA